MIKTHNVTGCKYLCKREADNDRDAIRYSGSGLKWQQHLKKFGKDLSTEILYICPTESKEEFRTIAIKYSRELNILQYPFLNMVFEEGQGGSRKETNGTHGKKWIYKGETRTLITIDKLDEFIKNGWTQGFPDSFIKHMSIIRKGRPAYNKGKKMKLPHEYKSKQSKRKYYIPKLPYTSEMRSAVLKECLNRPEVISKFKAPRKPLVTAQNLKTGEIKTMGRHEWWKFDKVNYQRLLRGRQSKGWKMVLLAGLEPAT